MPRTAQSLLVCSLAAAALAAPSPVLASQPFRTPVDAAAPVVSGRPGAHASFRCLGHRWPRGRITYYNAATSSATYSAWGMRPAAAR